MSYTELYQVTLDGDVEFYKEYHNSFRGAMLVWDTMAKYYNLSFFAQRQKIWDLYKDENVPLSLRIIMASTFDNVMVKRENLPMFITAIETFEHTFNGAGNFSSQIAELRKLANSDDCLAVCWNQTSVNCNPWQDWNDEIEDYKAYNIFCADRHWFLFEDDVFSC